MIMKLFTVCLLWLDITQETGQQGSSPKEERGGGRGDWARALCECFSWTLNRSLVIRFSLSRGILCVSVEESLKKAYRDVGINDIEAADRPVLLRISHRLRRTTGTP